MIKKYNYSNTFSRYLFENYVNDTKFKIVGPYGRGLEVKPDSTGDHIIFAGGTGILPFFDLLDFILKKSVQILLAKRG